MKRGTPSQIRAQSRGAPGRLRSVLTHGVLLAGVAVMAFPFLWMVLTALKSETEALGIPRVTLLPSRWLWGNFARAWHLEPFGVYFRNTFIVAGLVTAFVVLTALLAGYAFARVEFFGKRVLFVVFLATMMVPFEVVLIPNFLTVTWLKGAFVDGAEAAAAACGALRAALREGDALLGHLAGAPLPWTGRLPPLLAEHFGPAPLASQVGGPAATVAAFAALVVPWSANVFSIFLVTQFFRQLPQDYFDAAALDGCGHWGFVWHIGAPMVAPALVTAGLFSFLGSWNALLWPLVVNDPGEAPVIQVALARLVLHDEQQGFNLLMAASAFTMLPVVVLYVLAQRYFIEGITGSGLKG